MGNPFVGYLYVPAGSGEDEDAFAPVRCSDVIGSNARPQRVIPFFGQVRENLAESSVSPSQRRDVFQDHVSWSKNTNGVHDAKEQPTAITFPYSGSFSGCGDVLAGKSCGEHIDTGNATPIDVVKIAEVLWCEVAMVNHGVHVVIVFGGPGDLPGTEGRERA